MTPSSFNKIILNFKNWSVNIPIFLILFFLPTNFSYASTENFCNVRLIKVQKNKLKNEYFGPFRHPFKFTKDEIQLLLESIYFSKNTIFWSKPQPILSKRTAKCLAYPISKALAKSDRNKVVNFKVHQKILNLEGEVFINKNGLNWKISSISNLTKSFRQTGIWENNWKLVPKRGQNYYKYNDVLGLETKNLKWIVISGKNIKHYINRKSGRRIALKKTH